MYNQISIRMKTKIFFLLKSAAKLTVILLLFSSCLSQKKVRLLQEKAIQDVSSQINNPGANTYLLRSGDHLYIKVYSVDPKTSKLFQTDFPINYTGTYLFLNSYPVDKDGYINYSFIDKLYVKGLSVDQVRNMLQETINEYFNEATVYVRLVNFQVAVLGEVNSPGNYTLDQDQINIFQAISLAGGIKQFGNRTKVTLIRQTVGGSEVHYLDLTDNGILQSEFYYLMPNDMIYIEPYPSQAYAFEKFPYSTVLTFLSIAGVIASIVLNLK